MTKEREDYGGSRRDWTTEDECEWLDRLGRAEKFNIRPSFVGAPKPVKTRKELLTMYVANIRNRFDWGQMDREVCLAHAERALARMK